MKDVLRYLINENFVLIHYWTNSNNKIDGVAHHHGSVVYKAITLPSGDITPSFNNHLYNSDNDFFINYGIRVEDRLEADKLGSIWKNELHKTYMEFLSISKEINSLVEQN